MPGRTWQQCILSVFPRQSDFHSRKGQELLVGLNPLGQERSVPEQGVCGNRGGHILRRFLVGDMDDF